LAGEASAKDVDWLNIGSSELAHVLVAGDVGPVSGEDAAAELVGLALPGDAHPGSFQAKVEASDAAEQRTDIHAPPRQRFMPSTLPMDTIPIVEREGVPSGIKASHLG
jgi:hypothetical protein